MRPIATDTNDFPKMRGKGCIYVDKTKFVHRMLSDVGTNLFFISRPRRFGKSLTLSVLKALFSGRRELFEGLYIDKTDWKWEKYPVIHFEFNDVTTTSVADFETSFAIHVQERLEKAGFAYDKSLPPPENLTVRRNRIILDKSRDLNYYIVTLIYGFKGRKAKQHE